ncbi:MAG: fumarylacetoacetate hydrolase family protein [Pseudomonadota bacterium]
MRLGTIRDGGAERLVALQGEETLVDLTATGDPQLASMLALIDAGKAGLEAARAALAVAAVTRPLAGAEVLAPLPEPRQMRDCLVFEEHLINSFKAAEKMTGRSFAIPPVWYQQPVYYKANRFSVIGPEADVLWPDYAQFLDIELELAIVLGKTGKDIAPEDAPDHIFGYTIFNDMSARDAQMVEMGGQLGPAKGKDFDTGNILGPWIVTADEVAHPAALDMEAVVNGERWGGGNSRDMHHDFAAILAHISKSETIRAGEVIGSGTVGTGCGLEIGRQLAPGDVSELTVEKIGTLRNRIVKP